eukprot:scaffold16421_cov113-Isochrysis_galbana.AAC.2
MISSVAGPASCTRAAPRLHSRTGTRRAHAQTWNGGSLRSCVSGNDLVPAGNSVSSFDVPSPQAAAWPPLDRAPAWPLGDGSLMLQQMHESIHGFGRAQRFYAVRIIRGCAGAITGRQTVCHRKVVVSCPPQWGMMRAWRAGAARWNAHAPR